MLSRAVGHPFPGEVAVTLGAANFLTSYPLWQGRRCHDCLLSTDGLKGSTATAIVLARGLAGQLSFPGSFDVLCIRISPPDLERTIDGVRHRCFVTSSY